MKATLEKWAERAKMLRRKAAFEPVEHMALECYDDLQERTAEVKDAEAVAELHRNLNQRAADALGKPFAGEGSTWHDIPEKIEELKAEVERLRDEPTRVRALKEVSAIAWEFGAAYFTDSPMHKFAMKLQALINEAEASGPKAAE